MSPGPENDTHTTNPTMGYLRQDLLDPYYAVSDAADITADHPTWLYQDGGEEPTTSGVDWKVSNCCGTDEIIFLSLMAAYLVIIYFLWNSVIMKPMKLIAVFVHGTSVMLCFLPHYTCNLILHYTCNDVLYSLT